MMRTTQKQQMQDLIRHYKQETGETEVDMHKVADYAVKHGWPLPRPTNPLDALAAAFSGAARDEIRHDAQTGRPYRANHAFPVRQGDIQLFLWVDIDEAPRDPMMKSLINRREQIVGDVVQLTFDAEHWNSIHPREEPIVMPADFKDDVEWRKNGPEEVGA
jgi:hypothetical protein